MHQGYSGVVSQLKSMGIEDYHIYDPGNDYPNLTSKTVNWHYGGLCSAY